jgi:uncharacterized membrane protein HdeD (DUF308 family)
MELDPLAPIVQKAARWLLVWSIIVLICGILAILLPLTFSFAIAFVIGFLVLVAGIAHLVFAFRTGSMGGFLLHMLLCALYEIAALCLLANPLLSVVSLSLILAIFLLLEGLLEFILYFRLRQFRHSIWVLIDGIVTLFLGVMMAAQWPPATPEVIGALIGVSLISSAVSRIILSLAVRSLSPAVIYH